MTDPMLTQNDLDDLIDLRRDLHRVPELSGEEAQTAARVAARLSQDAPEQILTGLGGHGVAAIFDGRAPGPCILLRCELDALPIEELGTPPHRSTVPGKAHLCGHDGHMAILLGVARALGRQRPARGRVITLFQPAEETGAGARQVIADPRFTSLAPDYAFALHNMPGVRLGEAVLDAGVMNCASRGLKITLTGRAAHASQPDTGVSPAGALANLMQGFAALEAGATQADPAFARATVTHAQLGAPAFGVAPGQAELWVTLRTQQDAGMQALFAKAETLITREANGAGLSVDTTVHDQFRHCENDTEAVEIAKAALVAEGIAFGAQDLPMRASEDFGCFGDHAKSAMLLLGAGVDAPALHTPDYDFPDALIETGVRLFLRILHQRLS